MHLSHFVDLRADIRCTCVHKDAEDVHLLAPYIFVCASVRISRIIHAPHTYVLCIRAPYAHLHSPCALVLCSHAPDAHRHAPFTLVLCKSVPYSHKHAPYTVCVVLPCTGCAPACTSESRVTCHTCHACTSEVSVIPVTLVTPVTSHVSLKNSKWNALPCLGKNENFPGDFLVHLWRTSGAPLVNLPLVYVCIFFKNKIKVFHNFRWSPTMI